MGPTYLVLTLILTVMHVVLQPTLANSTQQCVHRCPSTAQSISNTCVDAMNQLQRFCVNETDQPGTCLLSMSVNSSLTFQVSVFKPTELISGLRDYFRFDVVSNVIQNLVLSSSLDVETVFSETNLTTSDIQLTISCWDALSTVNTAPSETSIINVTIIDADDNSPSFSQSADNTCGLPVFTASAHEQYIGRLETQPTCICATDGDFITDHDIILSFLHGDPPDYQNYFTIDLTTNAINKTVNMSSDDPRQYTFILQAKENSTQGRSSVAFLSVNIESGVSEIVRTGRKADERAKIVLQVLSAMVLAGFSIGFVILIWHRNRRVKPSDKLTPSKGEERWSKIVNNNRKQNNSSCDKQTDWKLESIDEEPELTSL